MSDKFEPLRQGATVDEAMVARILEGLRARTLPKPEWTHAAHLTAAAALLDERGLTGAEAAMPSLIRAYNEATGVSNTDSEGYHQTITLFFLRRIDQFLAPLKHEPLPECVTRLLASPLAERSYPLAYYSRDRLFSVEARRKWAPPDLKPIDD